MTESLCFKLCYDRTGAKLALASIARTKKSRKKKRLASLQRMYYCKLCRAWHLTSQAKR